MRQCIVELRPDFIKIEKSLIHLKKVDSTGSIIIENIIILSKQINSEIIVEGIDNDSEANTLALIGVRYGQGFFFSEVRQ